MTLMAIKGLLSYGNGSSFGLHMCNLLFFYEYPFQEINSIIIKTDGKGVTHKIVNALTSFPKMFTFKKDFNVNL